MHTSLYRVDSRLIPPVVLAMGFGIMLLILEGTTRRGFLLLILLLPFFYLGLETLARKILLDSEGITVSKFLRSARMEWADVESLDAVRSGSKVFLILQGHESRPILVTNTISPFRELVERILERVPSDKTSPTGREILLDPPTKHGPLVQAWIVCLVLLGVVAGRLMGYC